MFLPRRRGSKPDSSRIISSRQEVPALENPAEFVIGLADENETLAFAGDFALALRCGDVVALHGDLGSGKTTLAREIIRTLFRDREMEVPSPTFSIEQHYEGRDPDKPGTDIFHYDLYRLHDESEIAETGFLENSSQGITLIEWPEIAHDMLPDNCIHIHLVQDNEDESRIARVSGDQPAVSRIERSLSIRDFLSRSWQDGVRREPFAADASVRSYEHVFLDDEHRILMNAPRMPDGPAVRNGKPYSQIAHLAEDVEPFIAVATALGSEGLAAPAIYAHRPNDGLVLLEYLGDGQIITSDREPLEERYIAAMDVLVKLHGIDWLGANKHKIDIEGLFCHEIPAYSRDAMMIEAELLLDWYIPAQSGKRPEEKLVREFIGIWEDNIKLLESAERSLVLRDFHSPNIIWRPQKSGTDRIGIIDFQDAMIGPAAYDVASIGQDARVNISRELEEKMVNYYVNGRISDSREFDETGFRQAYAIMAAQRVTKILGIFIRLDRRDGKSAYLEHLPRMREYLARNLSHPVLHPYRDWLEKVGAG